MTESLDVVVIGGGQAGLAIGWHLRRLGASFAILDGAPQVGDSWRNRWDSLRLFTSARYNSLPGTPFPGDPDHYPTKDEVAGYLGAYAVEHGLPVRVGMPVRRLGQLPDGFSVETTTGTVDASQVVVATGAFQTPFVPAMGANLGARVTQLHSAGYRNPAQVPDGPVLVVGAGNSGLQIAAELAATHQVTVAVGAPPRTLPQRLLGKDIFWWLASAGLVTGSADSPIARRVRARGELVIGTRVADLRRHGVQFSGRVTGAAGRRLTGADGRTHTPATVVWATGFRSNWSWLDAPVLAESGDVVHQRGVTNVPGMYFLGLPWQHSRGSALLGFVQHDAACIAIHIAAGLEARDRGIGSRDLSGQPAHACPSVSQGPTDERVALHVRRGGLS